MQKRLFFLFALLFAFTVTIMAQVTTSGISGKITSQGEDVIGATITATHLPSGTVYRAVTNVDGRYTIHGMRVGGPYTVEVTYVGHKTQTFNNVSLLLGETQNLSCSLQEDSKMLDELVVTGKSGLNATKTGAAQSINAQAINDMPSISHGIADVARLNPQLNTSNNGAMSFAGINNRYNSFQIDGAMNNDVFGLATGGSNGGQAGTQPVSMETIEQIQINVAPYDVRQSGFTGGAINAITKSGTNIFHGSAYYYGYNENLIGRHYKMIGGKTSEPYQDESEYQLGFTVGGPIIKDKLFFFANYEKTNKQYPNLYGLGSTGSKVDADKATEILNDVKTMASAQGIEYNGQFTNKDIYTKSDKAGFKLDWNINDFNKFAVRWSYVNAKQLNGSGGISTLNTLDHLYDFKSKTNTFIAELQSRLSPSLSNEARASYVTIRDKRTSGSPFPSITIYGVGEQNGTVNIGNEYSSMANGLDQDIWTLEDNLSWYKGNHTFTFGTHNEVYHFSNLFIQNLYGSYYFNSYDNFINYFNGYQAGNADGKLIQNFYFNQANVAVTGDPAWKAKFSAGQMGFYAQDKWDAAANLQITYGLRMDIPLFFDAPVENATFNDYAIAQGWSLKTNRKLSNSPMWSPRAGFRWDINNDRNFILRGGAGLFTGRIPYVWLSNSFSNTGIQLEKYKTGGNSAISLILDPYNQAKNTETLKASGSGEVDVFTKDFKFSQDLRFNLGFDFHVLGIEWTAEAIYSKTLNDILYRNLAYEETGYTLSQTVNGMNWDNRPMYQQVSGTPYANIYELSNTSRGYSYNLSLRAEKHFNFGLDLMASYTFTKSKSVNSGTSSVAASNWNYNYTYRSSNNPELANSAFNIPHHVKASAFYHVSYGYNKMFTTTVGLIYDGQSGSPYSIYYRGDVNGDGSTGNDLIFIPTDEQIDQMKFTATKKMSADDQRTNFKQWIANDPYLSKHRGQYYKRYADNLPFESHFDLHIAEKINVKAGKNIHALELSFDVLNVANMLNKKWGHTYGNNFGSYSSPISYNGNGEFQFTQSANYSMFDYSDYYSRWRGQIGLKYTF